MKRPGIEERIKNTAELLRDFAKENLPPDEAEEILKILSDDNDEEKKEDENK